MLNPLSMPPPSFVRFQKLTPLRALSLGLAVAVLSSGCSTFGAHQAFTYRKECGNQHPEQVLTFQYDRAAPADRRPFFKDAYEHPAGFASSERLTSKDADGNDVTILLSARGVVRNRILYELMGMVDDYYFRYTDELRSDIAGKGIFSDTLGLATSLAATAAGGQQLKTVLSAISTAAQGVSKSIDANVLLGSSVQAIRLQMDAARSDLAAEMILKMKQQDAGEYPLEAGLRDIVRYYDAGTLTSGVAALSKESGKKKIESETKEKARATNTEISKIPAL
jgi:hypothetical protein